MLDFYFGEEAESFAQIGGLITGFSLGLVVSPEIEDVDHSNDYWYKLIMKYIFFYVWLVGWMVCSAQMMIFNTYSSSLLTMAACVTTFDG